MTLQSEVKDDPKYIPILDHGFVGLVDAMPSAPGAGDAAIVQAARVSYGAGTKSVRNDRGLIRYLLRHKHTTPFEMLEFKFHLKMPIFVARQHIRHRTANVNEYSGRYSEMSNEFYVPEAEHIMPQSTDNKQGRKGALSEKNRQVSQQVMNMSYGQSYRMYQALLGKDYGDLEYDAFGEDHPEDKTIHSFYNTGVPDDTWFDDDFKDVGIARELARIVMPLSNYTEMYWKIDLHNLFHYLKLRMDGHAQYEIRVIASAMYELIKPYAPMACEAFEDYVLNSVELSGPEMEIIRTVINKTAPTKDIFGTKKPFGDLVKDSDLSEREKAELLKKIGK